MNIEVVLALINLVQVLGLAYLAIETRGVHKSVNSNLQFSIDRAEKAEAELREQ